MSLNNQVWKMDKLFDIIFLDEVINFLSYLEKKHYETILFNIERYRPCGQEIVGLREPW